MFEAGKPAAGRLERLLALRWSETQQALGPLRFQTRLTWCFGDYPHFRKKRGFGVTFLRTTSPPCCHLMFAEKLDRSPMHRIDGIVRHELGHVVDMTVPTDQLDRWAAERGIRLPHTPERRADAIAEAIWFSAILYDSDLVQSTEKGVAPRPEHLGL